MVSALLISFGCKKEDKVKIGFSLGPVHDRWHRDVEYFTSKVQSMGGEVIVKESGGDNMNQCDQAEKLIKNGIDVLVIVPEDSEKAARIVKTAHNAGVKVLAYDRIIKNCDLDYYVSFDNVKVGELQAEYITKLCPKGNYVILGGSPDDNNSFLINLGQRNVLQPLIEKGDVKIVLEEFVYKWDEDAAFKIMDDFLQGTDKKIDAIIASNDPLANGVFRALKKHGLAGKVYLTGQDAEVEACKRIANGKQTMTVYKIIESLATTAANSAFALANDKHLLNTQLTVNNGKKMVDAILLPSMYVVHRENIRMTVVADGYIDESEII